VALAAIGEGASTAVTPLTEALRANSDPSIRLVIVQALWVIDRQQNTVLPILIEYVQDTKQLLPIRTMAVNILGVMGPAAKPAYPTLSRAQEEPDEALRAAIDAAIDRIGQPVREDVPMLVLALKAPNPAYRKAAVQTLWLLGPEARDAVPGLRELFNDKEKADNGMRIMIAEAFEAIGEKAKAAAPDLGAVLDKPEEDVDLRATALEALAAIGVEAKSELAMIVNSLKDKEARVRAAAVIAAGSVGGDDDSVIKGLEERLTKDTDGGVRVYAAQVHWHLKRQLKPVLPVLVAALDDPKPEVRIAAAASLGEIGPVAKMDAATKLNALKNDPNQPSDVRKAVTDALKKIEKPRDGAPNP
jgi:HEAT repeat protein